MSCPWSIWQRSSCREGEQKQNWLVGVVPIAVSSPFSLNNLGKESVIPRPIVVSRYGSSYSHRRQADYFVWAGAQVQQWRQGSTVHKTPGCTVQGNYRNILNVVIDAVLLLQCRCQSQLLYQRLRMYLTRPVRWGFGAEALKVPEAALKRFYEITQYQYFVKGNAIFISDLSRGWRSFLTFSSCGSFRSQFLSSSDRFICPSVFYFIEVFE